MKFLLTLIVATMLAGPARAAPPEAATLAPTGELRAAINFGNPVLAQRGPGSGPESGRTDADPHGVSADLARELARRLGVPVRFVLYDEAGQAAAAATQDQWDVAFLAIDPVRAATIEFTPPYVLIEGVYAVAKHGRLDRLDQVDQHGIHVGVASHSAYDLYLTRALKHAELVRFPNGAQAATAFLEGHLDALAGVKQPLAAFVRTHAKLRLLPGHFMEIRQAMALPKPHATAISYLGHFVEEMKSSGFVRAALDASGQRDAEIASPEH